MRKRNCVYPTAWPPAERFALEKAVKAAGLFSMPAAACWAPSVRERYCRGYGTWLHYLLNAGILHIDMKPAARANSDALGEFVRHLQDEGLAPVTILLTLRGMLGIIQTVDAQGNVEALTRLVRHWEKIAEVKRDKTCVLAGASEIYEAGLSCMRSNTGERFDRREALRYMDGLLMCMLISCPVRLKNLQDTRIGIHVKKTATGVYEWWFKRAETKNRRPISSDLPVSLTQFVDYWALRAPSAPNEGKSA
jgi:hypothetical protein